MAMVACGEYRGQALRTDLLPFPTRPTSLAPLELVPRESLERIAGKPQQVDIQAVA